MGNQMNIGLIEKYITLHATECFGFNSINSFEFSEWNWNRGLSKSASKGRFKCRFFVIPMDSVE